MKLKLVFFLLLFSWSAEAQYFWKSYLISTPPFFGEIRSYTVIQTSDSGYAFTTVTRDSANTENSFALVKTDASGNVQWSYVYDSLGYADVPYQLLQLPDNSFVVAGKFANSPLYYWRISSSGTLISVKKYSAVHNFCTVSKCPDGNLIFAGNRFSDHFLMKTDTGGNILWSKTFGHGVSNTYSLLYKVIPTSDGGFLGGGYYWYYDTTFSFLDSFDVEMIKVDGNGNLQWFRQLGHGAHSVVINDISETSTGDFLLCGQYFYSMYHDCLIKIDTSGTVKWFKAIGGGLNISNGFIKEKPDGNYVLASGWGNTPLVSNLDTAGNVLSVQRYNATPFAVASIIQTVDNGIAFYGYDQPYLQLLKTDSLFQVGCNQTYTLSPANLPYVLSTAINASVPVITVQDVTSHFSTTSAQFDIANVCFTTETDDHNAINTIVLYPNPVTNILMVRADGLPGKNFVDIYNATGQRIFSKQQIPTNHQITIDASFFSSGLYFVTVHGEKSILTSKFIKE